MKDKLKIIWQKLKAWFYTGLARLDKKRVAALLAACGIIAAIVLVIIIGLKMPMVLIGLMALVAVKLICDALHGVPRPV